MKKLITLFLFILFSSATAQMKYDTIMFNNITLNNARLITKFNHIKKLIDVTKTRAKVFTYNDIHIPFLYLTKEDFIYTVYSQNLGFSYAELRPDDILIEFVKPSKNLILRIETKNISIIMTKKNALSLLKRFYKNSFKSFQNDKKEFKLIVKKGNQYALCCLIFDNCRFVEMYLTEISQGI